MSTLTQKVSAFGASTAVAGAALIGGVPMTQLDTHGLFGTVQRDVGLVGINLPPTNPALIPDFDQSTKFLLDAMLGIGGKTLPQLLDPNGTTTLESLLGGSGLTLATTGGSTMTDVFDKLGLDDIQMSSVMGLLGLQPGDSFGSALGAGGALEGLGSLKLADLIGGLAGGGDGSALKIVDLVDAMGMGSQTLSGLLSQAGVGSSMGDLFTALGIPGLQGFLPLLGLTTTDPVTDLLNGIGMGGSLDTLLGTGGMLSSIGGMTLGTLLGFDSNTELGTVLGGLQFEDPANPGSYIPLSQFTFTQLLGEIQLNPNDNLATVLGNLPLGLGGADLGATSLAGFLGVIDGGTVDTNTTVTAFLTGAQMATLDIDHWLGLDGVDISNWYTP